MSYLWRFRRVPEPGMDPRYVRILTYLRDHGPASSRDLADALGFSYGFTRKALQFLRRVGAVEVFFRPGKGLEEFGGD